MTITYDSLVQFINNLNADGTLSKADLNSIIQYIISGGLTAEINIQKSNNGGTF
jgi:hypothetical protein